MSATEHEREARKGEPVRCAVLTISDTRTPETDTSGDTIAELVAEHGHAVIARDLVPDDLDRIDAALGVWIDDANVQAILTTGGTGVAKRDTTVEVVRKRLTHELEGFGELFRMISYEEIGAAAMMSRAVGGLAGETLLFAMPGSRNAVGTAMRKLIGPQLAHLAWVRG